MTQERFCRTCLFWDQADEEFLDGDCRRHAPRLSGQAVPHGSAIHQDPRQAMWPRTCCDDWCGEYAERPQ